MNYQDENTTLNYYNTNADQFYNDTFQVSFNAIQDNFTKYLNPNDYILDFGCGSGRDSKAFLEKGFRVDAIDGSYEMCRLAEKLINQKVPCIRFQDFTEVNKYDGIWACSSILHLDKKELQQVLINLRDALKSSGYLYTSFKYGSFCGLRNGRYFTDMTEESLMKLIQSIGGFEVTEIKISTDARKGREDEKWINVILRKSVTK